MRDGELRRRPSWSDEYTRLSDTGHERGTAHDEQYSARPIQDNWRHPNRAPGRANDPHSRVQRASFRDAYEDTDLGRYAPRDEQRRCEQLPRLNSTPAGRAERLDDPAHTRRTSTRHSVVARDAEPPAADSRSEPTADHVSKPTGDKPRVAPAMPPARRTAIAKLQEGDLVTAQCPLSGSWQNATIHKLHKSGLIEVRWHNPGVQADGKPYQPIGDVWAEKLRLRRTRGSSYP